MPIEFAIHIYIPTYHYDINVAVVNEVGRKTAEASAQRQLGSKQSETKCVYGVLALNFSICSERCATSYDFAEASVMRFCTSSRKIFDVSDGSWCQARARCASIFLSGRFLVARVAVTTSFCMRSFVAMQARVLARLQVTLKIYLWRIWFVIHAISAKCAHKIGVKSP